MPPHVAFVVCAAAGLLCFSGSVGAPPAFFASLARPKDFDGLGTHFDPQMHGPVGFGSIAIDWDPFEARFDRLAAHDGHDDLAVNRSLNACIICWLVRSSSAIGLIGYAFNQP